MLYDFFNKYVMIQLEQKLTYIDRYITENKKGFKNAIFSFLKTETIVGSPVGCCCSYISSVKTRF